MERLSRRLCALFVLGLLAFFPPFLAAFNRRESAFGVPLLPLFLFLVWLGLLAAAFLLTWRSQR